MADPPATAAWRLVGPHTGFEVLFLGREQDSCHFEGHWTGVEEGEAWGIRYAIVVDAGWVTRSAHVVGRSALGAYEVRLEGDGADELRVDGRQAPQLDGCLDVDLEGSAFTNAFSRSPARVRRR